MVVVVVVVAAVAVVAVVVVATTKQYSQVNKRTAPALHPKPSKWLRLSCGLEGFIFGI